MFQGFRKYMDPQGQGSEAGGGGSPQPIIYEHEGQKYNITELLGVKSEYEKYKDDLGKLENYKQDQEALSTLQAAINRDPELVQKVREQVGFHIAGVPAGQRQAAPVVKPAEQAQPTGEKAKTPWTPEQMATLQQLEQQIQQASGQISSVVTVEGQRAFESDKSDFLQKHPEFKDKMDDFYKAGNALIQEKANSLIRAGFEPNSAWQKAQSDVSSLSHEEMMYQSPALRKVYEDSLIQRVGGGNRLPDGIGTPAERLATGQPGMTPEADAEFMKASKDARMRGDTEALKAAYANWSRKTGRDPLEIWGFAPEMASGLTGARR